MFALSVLATGAFQKEIADRSGITQSSVSRMLDGTVMLAPQYIKFLYAAAEQTQIKRDFHAAAGLANTIGAIGDTPAHQGTISSSLSISQLQTEIMH